MHKYFNINTRNLSYLLLIISWLFFEWAPVYDRSSIPTAEAVSEVFTSSGQWEAPAGVTTVKIEVWGGGGAGGGRGPSTGQSGGGGGGAYASRTITVTPNQTYNYTVAAGVTGGTGDGPNGNLSQWEDGSQVKAAGGKGGLSTTDGGLGGAEADSAGEVVFKGGNGGNGSTVSGGGGGGAGSNGAGGNANSGAGGTGTSQGGGDGGDGVANANGNPGLTAGGGGAGARRTNGNRRGGDGAEGQIKLTYNNSPQFLTDPVDSPDPATVGVEVTFSATAIDEEGNSWYLAVCKTNFVTIGAPPTCAPNQTFCVSNLPANSGAQNSCTWTADQVGSHNWFAFACDNAPINPNCSIANTINSPINVSPIISVTITSDGIIEYGTLGSGESRSTQDLSDTQTAKNDSSITEDFNIRTSAPSGWSLGTNPGPNIFMLEFSIDGGSIWTKLIAADSYQTLATNIAPGVSQDFDLRLTAPNPSSDAAEKTINITIQATER